MSRKSAQDSRSSEKKAADRLRERQQQDEKTRDELVKHPCCAIIPSPDKLDISSTEAGQDEIATRKDFDIVWRWLTSSKLLNTGFYDDKVEETVEEDKLLECGSFNALVQWAFGNAFDAIYNTSHPDKEEMVLLYYSGHGLPINPTWVGGPSFPALNKLHLSESKIEELQEQARTSLKFLNPSQKLKGGELLLHDVGFCDLQGLLAPFVASLQTYSPNAPRGVKKKNKHLVVIADSCYSGVLAQDLKQLNEKCGPWNENKCSVTVQSACSEDEVTYGGYFTPCFVHFNKPENQAHLEALKKEWNKKNRIEKNAYQELKLPSPCVETTMSPEQLIFDDDPIMKPPNIHGFQLYLFRDPGFFKFCYLQFSEVITCEVSPENKPRVMPEVDANSFLKQTNFDIIDYKLKKMKTNGTPLALFLVEYHPQRLKHVVCAHIHFKGVNTDVCNVSSVTLVEHTRPKHVNAPFLESYSTKRTNICKNITKLVAMCKSHVDKKEGGRWKDVRRWNMKSNDLGVNNKFRLKDRSVWMDNYVKEHIGSPFLRVFRYIWDFLSALSFF